jgi:hypothetical protein
MQKITHISLVLLTLTVLFSCKKDNDNNDVVDPPVVHFSVKWDHNYNYWLNEPQNLHNLVSTTDGGAAVFFSWFNDTESGTCFLKTNADGSTDFLHEFTADEFGNGDASLIQTSDNGYLLYGTDATPVLGKTDADGNILWMKSCNYHQLQRVASITEKPAGGFLALAESYMGIYLIDLNTSGDTIRTFLLMDSLQIPDGQQVEYDKSGKIIVAFSGRINGDYRSFITAIDSNFNEIWSLQLAQAGHGIVLNSFYINNDNSLLAGGTIFTNGTLEDVGYIAGISATGSLNWSKSLSDIHYTVMDVELAPSGGYYLVGDHDNMITKINAAGDVLWRESLEPTNQIGPSGNTLKVSGNDILFFGNTFDLSSLNQTPVLIKFSEQ